MQNIYICKWCGNFPELKIEGDIARYKCVNGMIILLKEQYGTRIL